jgi:Uma2 family endonuclease
MSLASKAMSRSPGPRLSRQMFQAIGYSFWMPLLTPELDSTRPLEPLENGEHLDAREFLRRYETMPKDVKAELIHGIVYMGSAVRARQHGIPDVLIQTWLGLYAAHTPAVESVTNSTTCLSNDDVPQPDAILQILPECGGQSHIDADGYIIGPPELVVEVAASSSAIDAHEKRESYAADGVREYILWRTIDQQIDWWYLNEGVYQLLSPGNDGILRSKVFPGLWLNRSALLEKNRAALVECLERGLQRSEHRSFIEELAARQKSA